MGFFDKIKSALSGGSSDDVSSEAPSKSLFSGAANHVYKYPNLKQPLLQAFGGQYEACYVMLNQFYILDDDTPEEDILDTIKLVPWRDVIASTGIQHVPELNHALLTNEKFIGWTKPEMDLLDALDVRDGAEIEIYSTPNRQDNPKASGMLRDYAEDTVHFELPSEGVFDEYYFGRYIKMFNSLGFDEVIVVPQNPQDECLDLNLDVASLPKLSANSSDYEALQKTTIVASFDHMLAVSSSETYGFPDTGTVISPDLKFLMTLDSDSFFVLAYGSRAMLEKLTQDNEIEGFFAEQNTVQNWWDPKNF